MKTINLKSAYANATKGPFVVKCVPTSAGKCYKIGSQSMVEHDHGGICAYDDSTSLNPHKHGEQEHTAALLCHAFNVLPEVVEAAIEVERTNSFHGKHGVRVAALKSLSEALAKASSVPLPD